MKTFRLLLGLFFFFLAVILIGLTNLGLGVCILTGLLLSAGAVLIITFYFPIPNWDKKEKDEEP